MPMMRLVAILLVPLLLAAPSGVVAQEEPEGETVPVVTPEQRDAALKKAFGYLDDHLWRLTDGGSPEKQYAAAVAGWAYLLAGERSGKRLPSRVKQIKRIRDYLDRYLKQVERIYEKDDDDRRSSRPRPGMPPGVSADWMRTAQYTWPLSMAGFFFGESIGRRKDKRGSKKALKRIVKVLEACQQPNGGWGHDDAAIPGFGVPAIPIPKPGGGTGTLDYPHTLLAATNCAASALGAAYRILRAKESTAVEKAVSYYREAQNPDGTFPYDPSQKHPDTMGAMRAMPTFALATARTSGALFALYCLGVGEGDATAAKAAAAIDGHPEDLSEGHGSATMALQFGALVCRARGDATWETFKRIYFPRIVAAQDEDGAFDCICRGEAFGVTCDTKPPGALGGMPGYLDGKKVYVTAIHCLVLLLDRTEPESVPAMPGPKGPATPR